MTEWNKGGIYSAYIETRSRRHRVVYNPIARQPKHPWLILDSELAGDNRVSSNVVKGVQPLVTIDHTDGDEVQRLFDLSQSPFSGPARITPRSLQDGLAAFLLPPAPRISEPFGLGAVVVDTGGNEWVRFSKRQPGDRVWAYAETDNDVLGNREWTEINVVEIKSEGMS